MATFQFYDSPIKSLACAACRVGLLYGFNSMIVRLKAGNKIDSSVLSLCFNSMIVRLKEIIIEATINTTIGFNSMIVRLKDRMKIGRPLQYAGFNAMIVRLKGFFDNVSMVTQFLFQFYDSPIKSDRKERHSKRVCAFQFYDSPIKRQQRLLRYTEIIQFQFYDSPIKRVTCSKSSKYYMNFNSMIVRLKEWSGCCVFWQIDDFNSMIVRLKVFFCLFADLVHYQISIL